METKTYGSYEEAAQDYLIGFRALRDAPPAPSQVTTRGASGIAAETLIERADEIADVSASMVALSRDYLEAPDPTLREGISGQLIAQAAAELQVASELLQIAEGEEAAPPAPVTRAVRGTALRDAVNALERSMAMPVSRGLVPEARPRRAAVMVPATVAAAKTALQQTAVTSTGAITQQVRELGCDIAFDLIVNTEWTAVIEGAALLHKDIAEKLEAVKEGAGLLVTRAVAVATKTLLNVYDKIMALLGKDAEDQARQKVKEWLEKIKEEGKVDLLEILVDKLYRIDAFKEELAEWLTRTTAQVDEIGETTDAVAVVSDKFAVLAGRMNTLEDVIGLAKLIKLPQVLVVVASIQIALLTVLVYAGYDYIGYKELAFPNLTKGVAEVIQESLLS
ncbi:MAG: hypothetical protein ACFFA6_15140 [Promethearchaeota archaeon]